MPTYPAARNDDPLYLDNTKYAAGSAGGSKHADRKSVADILKCFSQRPDLLKSVIEFSDLLHFSDGHLTRRTKEMIATLVSGLEQVSVLNRLARVLPAVAGRHRFFSTVLLEKRCNVIVGKVARATARQVR